jgi:hypothetical protein
LAAAPVRFDEYVFVAAFPLLLMSVFMVGSAFDIRKHNPISFFVLCFSATFAVVLSATIYLCCISGRVLLPGVWTSFLPLIVGLVVIYRTIADARGTKV